jgi:hypothetical protein
MGWCLNNMLILIFDQEMSCRVMEHTANFKLSNHMPYLEQLGQPQIGTSGKLKFS